MLRDNEPSIIDQLADEDDCSIAHMMPRMGRKVSIDVTHPNHPPDPSYHDNCKPIDFTYDAAEKSRPFASPKLFCNEEGVSVAETGPATAAEQTAAKEEQYLMAAYES